MGVSNVCCRTCSLPRGVKRRVPRWAGVALVGPGFAWHSNVMVMLYVFAVNLRETCSKWKRMVSWVLEKVVEDEQARARAQTRKLGKNKSVSRQVKTKRPW
jgi:hypothetical protein